MAITNATLAQQILDMVNARITFDAEHQEWLGGVVGGGPFADGKYLLTNPITSDQVYVTCPAQLEDDVTGLVDSATTQAAAAAASAAAALVSENAAAGSVTTADAHRVSALAAQSAAETAESGASTNAATALAQANNAGASFISMDEKYLGAHAAAPTLNNQGGALQTGALYWNSTSDAMFVWTGAIWSAF